MYNNIGLSSVRGTATSGYVQANRAYVRPSSVRHQTDRNRSSVPNERSSSSSFALRIPPTLQDKANKEIQLHERKRRLECNLLELRERMEEGGRFTADEIEDRIERERRYELEKWQQQEAYEEEQRKQWRLDQEEKTQRQGQYLEHQVNPLSTEANPIRNDNIDITESKQDKEALDGNKVVDKYRKEMNSSEKTQRRYHDYQKITKNDPLRLSSLLSSKHKSHTNMHVQAELKEHCNSKVRHALGIRNDSNRVIGEAFDQELQRKRKMEIREQREEEQRQKEKLERKQEKQKLKDLKSAEKEKRWHEKKMRKQEKDDTKNKTRSVRHSRYNESEIHKVPNMTKNKETTNTSELKKNHRSNSDQSGRNRSPSYSSASDSTSYSSSYGSRSESTYYSSSSSNSYSSRSSSDSMNTSSGSSTFRRHKPHRRSYEVSFHSNSQSDSSSAYSHGTRSSDSTRSSSRQYSHGTRSADSTRSSSDQKNNRRKVNLLNPSKDQNTPAENSMVTANNKNHRRANVPSGSIRRSYSSSKSSHSTDHVNRKKNDSNKQSKSISPVSSASEASRKSSPICRRGKVEAAPASPSDPNGGEKLMTSTVSSCNRSPFEQMTCDDGLGVRGVNNHDNAKDPRHKKSADDKTHGFSNDHGKNERSRLKRRNGNNLHEKKSKINSNGVLILNKKKRRGRCSSGSGSSATKDKAHGLSRKRSKHEVKMLKTCSQHGSDRDDSTDTNTKSTIKGKCRVKRQTKQRSSYSSGSESKASDYRRHGVLREHTKRKEGRLKSRRQENRHGDNSCSASSQTDSCSSRDNTKLSSSSYSSRSLSQAPRTTRANR